MLTASAFNFLVDELSRRGYADAVAVDYAVRIGDTPELDADGQLVIRNDAGEIIERLSADLLRVEP